MKDCLKLAVSVLVCLVNPITFLSSQDHEDPPHGLFLTWQRDPATTMTIQWMREGTLLPLEEGYDSVKSVYPIPALEGKGEALMDNLWKQGFAVDFLVNTDFQCYPEDQFSAVARIGWSEEALQILVRVRQDRFQESDNPLRLWEDSSIEVILIDGDTADHRYHLVVTPGVDERFPEPRMHTYSAVPEGAKAPELVSDYQPKEKTYLLQVSVPWEAIPWITPQTGQQLRMQLYLNQRGESERRRLMWYPAFHSQSNPELTYLLKLANEVPVPYEMFARVRQEETFWISEIHALPHYSGRTVALKTGDHVWGESRFETTPTGQAVARVPLQSPAQGYRLNPMEVVVDNQVTAYAVPGISARQYALEETESLSYGVHQGKSPGETVTVVPQILHSWPGMFLYRTELVNLNPDTFYWFQIGEQGKKLRFRTMPKTLSRPLTVIFGGDNLHRKEWMEQTCQVALEQNPDFIVWGGDLADSNGDPGQMHRWRDWFEAIRNTLVDEEGRVVPILVAVGNHDVQKGYGSKHEGFEPTPAWRVRIAPQFYEFFAFPSQPGYGVMDFGDYLSIIILDTEHTNPIEGEQTDWLATTLQQRKNVRHVFPVYHVPAYPSVKNYKGEIESNVRKLWTPLFDQYAIRLAFEHHNHCYKRTIPIKGHQPDPLGTVYLGDGGWGVGVRPSYDIDNTWYLEKAISQRHAIVVTLSTDQQEVQVISSEGEILDEYSTVWP